MTSNDKKKKLVGVVEASTKDVTFTLFLPPQYSQICVHTVNVKMITPKEGWFEQDAVELFNAVQRCFDYTFKAIESLGYSADDVVTIGVTNQRETTIAWETVGGTPLYNALVWKDLRATATVDKLLTRVPNRNKNYYKNISGLPMSPFFSAFKIKWLLDNVPLVKAAYKAKTLRVGTVDSWIIWNLTKGALHITDVTNASRTFLMNIDSLKWDSKLLKIFDFDSFILPEIRSCSEIYGTITDETSALFGVPISGCIGNQQASLLGLMCINPGQAKTSYGTGCFLLCNVGPQRVISTHGLLTTVAYKLGPRATPCYALEGAIAVGGQALIWLQDKVRILPKLEETEKIAKSVDTTGDVYFVPAFSGLYAPYWRKDARGIICGLTQFSTKAHIIRAALEAICFQTLDIMECINLESGYPLTMLHADGNLASNNLLMQLQADTAGIQVLRTQTNNAQSFGAAMCAGQANGIDLCCVEVDKKSKDIIKFDTFKPNSKDSERCARYGKWKRAVERSLGWTMPPKKKSKKDGASKDLERGSSVPSSHTRYAIIASLPASIFLISTFAMLIHSMIRLMRKDP